jgi:uncharacterized protein (TIGR02145 family)
MKTTIFTGMLCLLWIHLIAQVPQKMSYQTVIRDAGGSLVTNKQVGMRIAILEGSLPGTVVYQETQTPVTNANGLVTLEIGGSAGFDSIHWSNGLHFIKTETDPSGGTSYSITGTSQLLSVPYAFFAEKTENSFSGNYNDLINKPTILNNANYSTATGYMALKSNAGGQNTANGYEALYSNTNANYNTAIGAKALHSNTSATFNTAIGANALYSNTTAFYNTATGAFALWSNTTGQNNTANGAHALYSNITGQGITAIGSKALQNNTTGNYNTADGNQALYSNTLGNNNTAMGYQSGYTNSTGNGNVFLGHQAGYYETGSNKLFIDNQSRASESDAKVKALIYGVFDADPANQILSINGNINVNYHRIVNVPDPVNNADVATKAYVDAKFNQIVTNVADIDRNVYPVLEIGTHYWMAENLKTTKLNDGSSIPLVSDRQVWLSLTAPGFCWYNSEEITYSSFGALYNWYAVNTGKLCPAGWHVPSSGEYATLCTDLGGASVAGVKMKSWPGWPWQYTYYPGLQNTSHFSGLPGGLRQYTGYFAGIGTMAYLWSSTERPENKADWWGLFDTADDFGGNATYKGSGMSIRCIKD